MDVLPGELWSEILIRLPVKSMLRCRSVCKSCHSLISNPNFISNYASRNLNKSGNRFLVQLRHSIDATFSYSSRDESSNELSKHINESRGLAFVGSCNGLICLYKYDYVHSLGWFQLWNPTIWKTVELPFSPKPYISISRFGFGFDPKTSDYKVMVTVGYGDNTETGIFDLSKGVWRGIGHLPRPPGSDPGEILIDCPPRSLYLNGAIHWIQHALESHSDVFILSFSVSDEVFLKIQGPLIHDFDDNYSIATLVAFDGLICVMNWNRTLLDCMQVWVMNEYGVTESWSKVFTVDLGAVPRFPQEIIHLWRNGNAQFLMIDEDCGGAYVDLLLYNIHTGSSKFLHHSSTSKTLVNMIQYQETLALM